MTQLKCSWLSQNLKKYCLSIKKTKENQFNHNIKSKRNTSLLKHVLQNMIVPTVNTYNLLCRTKSSSN